GVLEMLASAWSGVEGRDTWTRGGDCDTMVAVSCDVYGHVTRIDTYGSTIAASIPEGITGLKHLSVLSIESSQLKGSLPAALFSLPNLIQLFLTENSLSGSIPYAVGNAKSLETLCLSDNFLNGTLPSSLGNLSALVNLILNDNFLSGSIPESLSNLQNLQYLSLDLNQFNSSIPDTLSTLQKLTRVLLDHNSFTGSIPESIGDLTGLRALFLHYNSLSGTIPASLVNLDRLTAMALSENYLAGTIPAVFSTLTALQYLFLGYNQLVGNLPSLKLMRSLKLLAANFNYLTGAAEAPPACPTYRLVLDFNCFAANLNICGKEQTQKSSDWCKWFCGNEPFNPPCSGHGVCYYAARSTDLACACESGYIDGSTAGTCVAQGPYIPSRLSSYSQPVNLFQSASSAPNGSIFLAPPSASASWGAAFIKQPITLFLSTSQKTPCDQPISFLVSFAFRMTPASAGSSTSGEGLAFVVTATAPQGAAAGVGLGGVGKRSVAVEFDSVLSVKQSDPNDNHVGVNVGGSPVSLASATAPLILNDGHTKHAWIHYDPSSGGTLRVFLSASRQHPSKAVVTARVSLCSALKPTVGSAFFLFGFVAASANNTQRHDILSWKIDTDVPPAVEWQSQSAGTAFGRVASAEEVEAGGEGESVPTSFHYASLSFLPTADGLPMWKPPAFVTWMRNMATWPVKNQHGCADSSAYAVVAAVEAAYSIMESLYQPPRLSVEQLRVALSANCDDMPPRDVLAFLVAATRKGGGLVDDAAAAAASPHSMASAGRRERQAAKPKYYGIQGFEESSFGGWLGLLLAVQRQPVIVRIEASAPSFLDYDGKSKYENGSCFQNGVNHAVLVVGYGVETSNASPFRMPAPLWVIRNSWGSGWGAAGHMFMDMRSGPGVCGINTLPGIFPILRSTADPCGSKSVMLAGSQGVAGSNAFNPCGQFKCSKAGASNRCACAAPHFVQASHPDGSNTCAYVDACGLAGSNPCVVGTCVNDGKGSYSCVCPSGFVQGTTAKGTLSCAPGDNKGSYTVRGSSVWCSHLLPVLGLTLDELKQKNKKLSCSKPIPVGFKLNIAPPQLLPKCSLVYTTHLGDSCASIAALFGLSEGCPVEGEACEEALVGLNPGLDCAALTGRVAVCVEREESKAGMVAVCDQQYEMEGSDGCDAARIAVNPPLSPLEFYRLNPGINCNNRLPTATFEGFSQRKVGHFVSPFGHDAASDCERCFRFILLNTP
ncbi:unnamed protein product, partial [Closterium sp. Naga37s-1]